MLPVIGFMVDIKVVSIIANGAVPDKEMLHRNLAGTNLLVAADGGAEICRKLDITPQFIVGDLDSVSTETIDFFTDAKIVHVPDQDTTDLEKTLEFAERFFPRKIKIFAATGNRADHFISNLYTFLSFKNNMILEIYDDQGVMKIIQPGKHKIMGKKGNVISIFSLSNVKDLSFINFAYSPAESDFPKNFTSISNELEEDTGYITFSSGTLLIYLLNNN